MKSEDQKQDDQDQNPNCKKQTDTSSIPLRYINIKVPVIYNSVEYAGLSIDERCEFLFEPEKSGWFSHPPVGVYKIAWGSNCSPEPIIYFNGVSSWEYNRIPQAGFLEIRYDR